MVGASIAARVSLSTASVCLLEAAGDVAEGATKGNGGVTDSGFGRAAGTLETELVTGFE